MSPLQNDQEAQITSQFLCVISPRLKINIVYFSLNVKCVCEISSAIHWFHFHAWIQVVYPLSCSVQTCQHFEWFWCPINIKGSRLTGGRVNNYLFRSRDFFSFFFENEKKFIDSFLNEIIQYTSDSCGLKIGDDCIKKRILFNFAA